MGSNKFFSGLTTIENLKDRCEVDDLTGCWHWQGKIDLDATGRPAPKLWIYDSVRGVARTMSGPIAVLELMQRRKPGVTMGWRTCDSIDCLCPEHIAGGSRHDFGAWLRATGRWQNNPHRIAAARKAAHAKAKITMEVADEIRASPLNGRQAAKHWGLSPQYVSRIRTNKMFSHSVARGASVFNLAPP